MNRMITVFALALALAVWPPVGQGDGEKHDEAREQIASRFPGVTPQDVTPSPISGLYEVMAGPIVIYTSADGRYMVRGDIYDLEAEVNLTESRVEEARVRALDALTDDEIIAFGKAGAPYTVTVFTDVDCGYCRVFHSKIDEYNSRGIRVRYAAFPRNGLASNTWQTMEQAWCAKDRHRALTLAKLDREFEHAHCEAGEKVMEQWQLGRMLGVRGTPAIFTSDGKMIPGYLPPDDLLKRLQAMRAGK